ncbi:MAG TPA: hypothetical protein VFJ02_12525, partial [Vicinamibacterales bacterium]|nr:hypothetical protein [Vicinamibacterales bacterium]
MIRNDLRGLGTAIVMMAALVSTGTAQTSSSQAAPTQTPAAAPPPAGDSIIVVEKPTYVTIALETTVNRPVAEVWKRIGGYCAIGEWFQMAAGCKILSGTDNEIGAVRSVANEVLVVKSQYSYT